MQEHNKNLRVSSGPTLLDKLPLYRSAAARWETMDRVRRGIALVSLGSLTLVAMATLVKHVGERLPAMEIFFFRSLIGFFLVLAVLWRDPFEALRTKRPGMHFVRGATGAVGNACFFWTLTHMLLADAMALQFSRPLFMIPLAILFLGEFVGWNRIGVALIGFVGIVVYARPFTAGFEPGVFVGALGAFTGGLVVICIKRLQTSEPTRVIMFYYAFWNALIAAVPALIWWVTPNAYELSDLDHGRLPRDFRTGAHYPRPVARRRHRPGAARLFAHPLFGRDRLSLVPRGPRTMELCRHGVDHRRLALSRADGEAAAGDRACSAGMTQGPGRDPVLE